MRLKRLSESRSVTSWPGTLAGMRLSRMAALRPSVGTYFKIGKGGCGWPCSSGSTLRQPGTAVTSITRPNDSARSGENETQAKSTTTKRRFMGGVGKRPGERNQLERKSHLNRSAATSAQLSLAREDVASRRAGWSSKFSWGGRGG